LLPLPKSAMFDFGEGVLILLAKFVTVASPSHWLAHVRGTETYNFRQIV
jgi:hypothetical protein